MRLPGGAQRETLIDPAEHALRVNLFLCCHDDVLILLS
jgi:hypothetical protein